MSELEPGIEKSDDDTHSPGGDEYTVYEKEKNPSFLLGAISFVIALLFIIIYFNAGYNSVLLLGAIIFGLAGMLLISSQRGKARNAPTTVPGEQVLERIGVKEGHVLLGLYEGTPLTAWGRQSATILPERITIYQRAIEDYCNHNPERIRKQVRKTVLHEVAHHFGIGHEEMPIWVK